MRLMGLRMQGEYGDGGGDASDVQPEGVALRVQRKVGP